MSVDGEELFELSSDEVHASGVLGESGFLVRAGAIARASSLPSATGSITSAREHLIANGVLVRDDHGLRFSKDYTFASPSGAASVILGRPANGWVAWTLPTGETLSEVKRIARETATPILDQARREQILECHRRLVTEGTLPSQQQLDREFTLFGERFGPKVLADSDGEALLNLLHDSTRDSLAYWLEFKNDEEFETRRYGSVAGGSALKFRVFRRKESGTWQAADNSNTPRDITLQQAIGIARSHREQLLRGAELLAALPENATDEGYAELQDQMDEQAPNVSRLGWGHKYFFLLFPAKLDNYHSPDWQRYILLKLLQRPPEGKGRYISAGRFIAAAREVGLPVVILDRVLTTLFGSKHRYWRVGTTDGKVSHWEMMQNRSCVAVGWPKLGDIGWVERTKASREALKKLLAEKHPNVPSALGNDASQITDFVAEMAEGDLVLAAEGATILGVGRVSGEYRYEPEFEFPHQRDVEWLDRREWTLPISKEGLQSTVREIHKYNENVLAIERRIQNITHALVGPAPAPANVKTPARLSGLPGRIQSVLERKGQVILYGPPGTGKTYWAERTAVELAAFSAFGKSFDNLGEEQRRVVVGNDEGPGAVRLCCFHPAYGYEDFIEGYRPQEINGHVSFSLQNGIFKKLCHDADAMRDRSFYLIIDEINRGDIPRIFGELLTILERDKRGKRVVLPVSQEPFFVPRNVFVLGTMNTADRSISLLDAALRRRFGFVELMPDGSVIGDAVVEGIPLRPWFEALNTRIRNHVGRDARNLQIGHSYLMHGGSALKDISAMKRALRDDIIPLLEEYCYERYDMLESILGNQLVDVTSESIRHELFEDGQEGALVQGLLAPFPEIATSLRALASEEAQSTSDGETGADEP